MRYVVAGIVVLVALLQYRLWFAEGGMRDLWRLREQVEQRWHGGLRQLDFTLERGHERCCL